MLNLALPEASEALSLAEASKLIPGRPSIQTMRRWIGRGLANGAKLESFRVGKRRFTTRQAVEDFLQSQNAEHANPRRQADAEQQLAELGV